MRLAGKVAIITGAGLGIGRATALLFAREGARAMIADSDRERGEEAVGIIKAGGGDAIFSEVDVRVAAQARRMAQAAVETYGRLDILVNNAGVYIQANVLDTAEEEWDRILDVNLKGAFLCSRYCIPEMIKAGGGSIVNIGSEAGLVGIRNQVAYNVSKGAIIALTRSMAVDFAAYHIRVNCVCPGTTETPLVKAAVERAPDPAAARRALEEVRPANRLGRPEEIAAGILYLASDESPYATGAVLSIDGGYTAQ